MSKNYIIGGGTDINFYEELYKSLDDPSKDDETGECLISNSPLTENYIQLECNHKFNYLALYNDLVMHKKTFNRMERRILKPTEIRCPYCRNIQTNLIPYCEMDGVKLVHGVNYYDELAEKMIKTIGQDYVSGSCEYATKCYSIDVNGKKILTLAPCQYTCVKKLDLNGKMYCSHHKYYAIKDYQKEEKKKAVQKIKDEKKKVKEEEKAEKQKKKIEENAIKQAEKLAAKKHSSKKIKTSNLENSIIEPGSGCIEILKSGLKKGTICGCKIKQNNFCGRHFKPLDS